MLYKDFEATTVDEATTVALKTLNTTIEEIKIEVLTKEKRGFFGVGKKEGAKIRVYYKENNKIGDIINEIKTIVGFLDREATVKLEELESQRHKLVIHSKNINHLIGKRGRHLRSLQILINAILQKHDNKHKIIVDIGNYNQKQEHELINWINDKAKLVLSTKKPVVLKSFNSYKRRLVHLELKKYKDLISESKGEGKSKSIKISYSQKTSAE